MEKTYEKPNVQVMLINCENGFLTTSNFTLEDIPIETVIGGPTWWQ